MNTIRTHLEKIEKANLYATFTPKEFGAAMDLLREAEQRAESNWKAGAEAMRESAAVWLRDQTVYYFCTPEVARELRALPIPEEPRP